MGASVRRPRPAGPRWPVTAAASVDRRLSTATQLRGRVLPDGGNRPAQGGPDRGYRSGDLTARQGLAGKIHPSGKFGAEARANRRAMPGHVLRDAGENSPEFDVLRFGAVLRACLRRRTFGARSSSQRRGHLAGRANPRAGRRSPTWRAGPLT
jgi:hypothetical protein